MKKQTLLLKVVVMLCIGARIVYSQGACWVEKQNMSKARGAMPAVVLNNTIYAIGGSLDAYTSTSIVEAYDTAANSWTSKPNLPLELCGETAGTINDKIYVIGGSTSILGDGDVFDNVYEYNPTSNSWTRKTNIPIPVAYAAADVVDGKIYVFGGCPFGFSTAYKSVYEYNPATDTWNKKKDMPTARFLASATAVGGKIYVFGGMATLAGMGFSVLEVYDPSADTWATKGPMPGPRCALSSSAVDGNIYIIGGGERMGSVSGDVLRYDPTSNTWVTRTSIPTPRVAPAACSVGRKIYTIGGMDVSNTRLTTVEEYDPALEVTSAGESHDARLPMEYSLCQNYPNPFNPSTTIRYVIPHRSHVTLAVFNTLGQKLVELVNADIDAGHHEIQFNATNLASGVYFYRIQAGSFVETRKLVLMQ